MNEVMDALVNRRSVRKYKAEAVPEELVKEIVEAGLYAPSGMGYQKPVILAVTDKETRDELSDLNRKAGGWKEGFDPFYGAPVVISVLTPKDWDKGVRRRKPCHRTDASCRSCAGTWRMLDPPREGSLRDGRRKGNPEEGRP